MPSPPPSLANASSCRKRQKVLHHCVEGNYCDESAERCRPKLSVGGTCEYPSGSVCEEGLYCTTEGRCGERKLDGEPCGTSGECIGFCDLNTATCSGGFTETYVGTGLCAGNVMPFP